METFNKCVQTLKTSMSDNEKLAALMVIAKLSPSIELDKIAATEVFNAITPKFLLRLIKTRSPSDNNSFQHLAFNIITVFARINPEVLVKNEELVKQLLLEFQDKECMDTSICSDGVDILLAISNIDEGKSMLLANNCFTSLTCLVLKEEYFDKLRSLFTILLQGSMELHTDFMSMLVGLSNEFKCNQHMLKFQYMNAVLNMLKVIHCIKANYDYEHGYVEILRNITCACKDLLQSRVKVNIKRSVVTLISNLIDVFGYAWLFDQNCVTNIDHLVLLLLTVISIELAILLNADMTSRKQLAEEQEVIKGCFHVTKSVMMYLCEDKFQQHVLSADSNFIVKVFKCLKNVMTSVYSYLKTIDVSAECLDDPVVVHAVLLVCVWATEETENLREELCSVLPLLTRLAKQDLEEIMSNCGCPKLLDFMAPCISQLLPDEAMRKILVYSNCHDVYAKYFSFVIESSELNVKSLERISHLIHQFIILEPMLLAESVLFRDLFSAVVKLMKLCKNLHMNSYCKLEIAALSLNLTRLLKVEVNSDSEQIILVSLDLLSTFIFNSTDDEFAEMWIIGMQNVIECVSEDRAFRQSLQESPALKLLSMKKDNSVDIDALINQLLYVVNSP